MHEEKWNPAVKNKSDQIALLNALIENKIDVIATDHAPHTIDEKNNKRQQNGDDRNRQPVAQLDKMLKQRHLGVFGIVAARHFLGFLLAGFVFRRRSVLICGRVDGEIVGRNHGLRRKSQAATGAEPALLLMARR